MGHTDYSAKVAIAKGLIEKGIHIKPDDRIITYREKLVNEVVPNLEKSGKAEIHSLVVDSVTPAQQYALFINALGGPERAERVMPGKFDQAKYEQGMKALVEI